MSYILVEAGYGRVLILAMEHDFPERMELWKKLLAEGKMTHEMRDVFQAMGYPVPRQRKEKQPPPPAETVEEVIAREDGILKALRDAPPVELPDSLKDEHGPLSGGDVVRFAHGDEPLSDYEPGLLDEPQPKPY